MVCEQCQQNLSSVLITEFVSGAMPLRQLCALCAAPILTAVRPDEIVGATFLKIPGGYPNTLPQEIDVPPAISVANLAAALRLHPCQVIGSLMRLQIFVAAKDSIDFESAARLCSRYGVIPRRVA